MIPSSFTEAEKLYNLSVGLSTSWISKYYPHLNRKVFGVGIERVQAFSQHFFFTCLIERKKVDEIWSQYPSTDEKSNNSFFYYYLKFFLKIYKILLSTYWPREEIEIRENYQIVILSSRRHLEDQMPLIKKLSRKFKILIVGKIIPMTQKELSKSNIGYINVSDSQRFLGRLERVSYAASFVLASFKKRGHSQLIVSAFFRKRLWYLVLEQFPEIAANLALSRNVFEKSKPNLLLTTSSNDVFGASFCLMAKKMGIKVAELQHGYINRGIEPRFYNANYQLVWGKIAKKIYDVSSTKAIIVGSTIFKSPRPTKPNFKRGSKIKLLVLFALQFGTVSLFKSFDNKEVILTLIGGLSRLPKNFEIILRSHPTYNLAVGLADVALPPNITIDQSDRIEKVIARTNVILTQPTTAGFLAVLYNKPLLFFNNSWITEKYKDPLTASGSVVSVPLDDLGQIDQYVLRLLGDNKALEKQQRAQKNFTGEYCSYFGKESCEQIAKFAKKIIDEKSSGN